MPDAVFLALKARATESGRSLSEFLRGLLEESVAAPVTLVAPRRSDQTAVLHD